MSSVAEQIAKATWQRLAQARRHKVRLGEETLTDLLALDLVRGRSTNCLLLQTTKSEEAKHGTDLEIYIHVGGSKAIVVAIQAKKLDRATGTYLGLNAKVGNTHRLQIDVLESHAKQIHATPRYLLYNYVDLRSPAPYWHCCRESKKRQLGCTLVPVGHIRDALASRGARKFHPIHLQRGAVPWRCLFECPMAFDPAAKGTKGIGTRADRLRMLADSAFAREGAWPDWLWEREGDGPMSEEELTRLYEVMRSSDSARQPEDQMHPLYAEPPRLIPRRILLVRARKRVD